MHVGTGIAHGADHPVEGDEVLAVAAQGHLCGVDRLDRSNGIALDARHLNQAAHRVASQSQVVLEANLGRVLQLCRGGAEHFCQPCRRHGAG
ncbi:hypothetical protein D9M71_817180 [compost metagenome]